MVNFRLRHNECLTQRASVWRKGQRFTAWLSLRCLSIPAQWLALITPISYPVQPSPAESAGASGHLPLAFMHAVRGAEWIPQLSTLLISRWQGMPIM